MLISRIWSRWQRRNTLNASYNKETATGCSLWPPKTFQALARPRSERLVTSLTTRAQKGCQRKSWTTLVVSVEAMLPMIVKDRVPGRLKESNAYNTGKIIKKWKKSELDGYRDPFPHLIRDSGMQSRTSLCWPMGADPWRHGRGRYSAILFGLDQNKASPVATRSTRPAQVPPKGEPIRHFPQDSVDEDLEDFIFWDLVDAEACSGDQTVEHQLRDSSILMRQFTLYWVNRNFCKCMDMLLIRHPWSSCICISRTCVRERVCMIGMYRLKYKKSVQH